LSLCGLNVWRKKIKDWSMFLALFDVQAKGANLRTYDRFALMCDGQNENRPIKLQRL
jgi:hypothetical protein